MLWLCSSRVLIVKLCCNCHLGSWLWLHRADPTDTNELGNVLKITLIQLYKACWFYSFNTYTILSVFSLTSTGNPLNPLPPLNVQWTLSGATSIFGRPLGTSGTSLMHVGRQAQVFLCVICMTRHFDLLKVIFHVFSQWQSKEISSCSCRQSESFFIRPHKKIV